MNSLDLKAIKTFTDSKTILNIYNLDILCDDDSFAIIDLEDSQVIKQIYSMEGLETFCQGFKLGHDNSDKKKKGQNMLSGKTFRIG